MFPIVLVLILPQINWGGWLGLALGCYCIGPVPSHFTFGGGFSSAYLVPKLITGHTCMLLPGFGALGIWRWVSIVVSVILWIVIVLPR